MATVEFRRDLALGQLINSGQEEDPPWRIVVKTKDLQVDEVVDEDTGKPIPPDAPAKAI